MTPNQEIQKTQETPEIKKPLPPFNQESAIVKVRLAEDAWNNQNPNKIALAYTKETIWRNRNVFPQGREQIIELLKAKWQKEHQYRLIKELWAYNDNRIAVRFAYEWHNDENQWFRSYGNENWQFDENGLMAYRHASINDLAITEQERKFYWSLGRRPDDHASLTDLGL
ncbi:MAG: nuclear transport factor 2 (NTF2) superfamily protein [Alteromonadaceae bacterium]|jgi:nuclear transport factor 2 (NTF2) superfamily protein